MPDDIAAPAAEVAPDHTKILSELREAIAAAKDADLQIELFRLHDVLLRADAHDPWVFPTAQAALAASKANPPAVAALLEARNRIDLHTINRQGGIVAFIRTRLGRSPVFAILVGTLLSLPLAATIYFVAFYVDKAWTGSLERWPAIGLICLSATFGACVSLITRIDFFARLYVYDPFLLFLNGLLKPIATSGLALTVYCIFLTQIISVTKINVGSLTGQSDPNTTLIPEIAASLWIVGFLVGFSERLAQDLISRTEALLSGAPTEAKPKDPGQ
jgi:hypothetical protein